MNVRERTRTADVLSSAPFGSAPLLAVSVHPLFIISRRVFHSALFRSLSQNEIAKFFAALSLRAG
ncbi:hypothetical protein D3C80_1940070 [compost metagenome]